MAGPGSSVFQGVGSIVVDNASQRQEEEEFLAEEQHRKAELASVMKTAFGDLEDDEDASSIASSRVSSVHNYRSQHHSDTEVSRSSSYGRSFRENGPVNSNQHRVQGNFAVGHSFDDGPRVNGNTNRYGYDSPPDGSSVPYNNVEVDFEVVTESYKKTDVNSLEQLQILYDIRMREIESLRMEIDAEKRSKDQILRKLVISETEKQQIAKTLADCHATLSETGERVKDLEREQIAIEEELERVRKEKEETKQELDIAKFQILQMDQQIKVLERCGAMKNPDKHIDGIVSSLNEKHKRELNLVKSELNEALQKIKNKDEQNRELEIRLGEVERNHNATLLDKCDATVRQDVAIKALLDETVSEKIQLTKQIVVLQEEVEALRNDLELYETIPNTRLLSSTSSGDIDDRDLSPSNCRERKSNGNVDILKAELNRAVIGQRKKRMEIRRLQEQVQFKEVQVAQLREQEKAYLTDIEKYKAEVAALHDRISKSTDHSEFLEKINCLEQLISVIDKEKTEKSAKVDELEAELEKWKKAVAERESAAQAMAEQYMNFHEQEIKRLKQEQEESAKKNELEWRMSMDRILGECDEIKKLYLEMRSARDSTVEKLEAEKQKIQELSRTNKVLEEKIASLKQQVSDLEEHILKGEQEKDDMRRQQRRTRLSDGSMRKSRDAGDNLATGHCDQADFEKLRDEVCAAKKRYLELEVTLKTEFESNVVALREENDRLKTQLRNYESRLEEMTEVATQTMVDHDVIRINDDDPDSRRLEEFDKLQTELERLRILEISRCKEIMDLKASFQMRLHEKIDELESKLMPASQDDLEAAKEQVKSTTSQYFLGEIAKIREAHQTEIENLQTTKDQEIHRLQSELKLKSNEAQSIANLKAQLIEQQTTLEQVKTRTAQIVTNIAKEFEQLKNEKEELVGKLEAVLAKSEKYKQSALKYKKLFEKIKQKDLPQRYERLVALVESKESEIISKIKEVSDAYQAQQEIRSHQS
ncbi:Hypothetical protein NTJ_08611 [Nesidiocoris tenuis]|uniref:Centrosomal protein of 162 kDa n=1 Tax=Nesidiocoris tenuis TaxID=355587 RepID=A0ABN7AUD3_9HEMI|nr:Hypothetical protein NTJ_08611 [Nesidiocoris tenuis]